MGEIRHNPNDQTWDCTACGNPWPCATRRTKFLDDYQGKQKHELRAVLALFMYSAQDTIGIEPGPAHERFIGWTFNKAASNA